MNGFVTVVGGGLAGCEAAWQLMRRGISVHLFEMRPFVRTPAHSTAYLAEVVCSNSFGGEGDTGAAGILKAELELNGSLILECARTHRVPAGTALAVDRERFAGLVSHRIEQHPRVEIKREEITALPDGPAVIATGPLTSPALAASLRERIGEKYLSFFDAVAPIVTFESVDMSKAYVAGRYGRGDDYINCPMNKEEYLAFYEALRNAERAVPHSFEEESGHVKHSEEAEQASYFEGCIPVEVLASRGIDTLRFGPMKPVGLPDPKTGREPYAVVQLRQDNREATLFNLVGFQTGLKWGEQSRLIQKIPGLERAEVVRFGVMHRNIYVNAPTVLDYHLRLKGGEPGAAGALFLAGQITGVEGYMESTAMGLVAGINAARLVKGEPPLEWPRDTAIGSLLHYLQNVADAKRFQPMNINLGLLPPMPQKTKDKRQKMRLFYMRALTAANNMLIANGNGNLL